jgi:cell division protein FtsB
MAFITILLTGIQFYILIFLYFKVKKIDKMMEQQQVENNELVVSLKQLQEKVDKLNNKH